MVSETGKPGFKGFHLLSPLFLQPVLIFSTGSQRSGRSQLDVLRGSGWLRSVGKCTWGQGTGSRSTAAMTVKYCSAWESPGILNNLF